MQIPALRNEIDDLALATQQKHVQSKCEWTLHGKTVFLAVSIAAFSMSSIGQTAVTNNNDGASLTVPVYVGPSTLANSPISISTGLNVGIGTTSAQQFGLQINGNYPNDGLMVSAASGTSQYGGVVIEDWAGDWLNNDNTGDFVVFATQQINFSSDINGTAVVNMSITNAGNVGIGTENPASLFSVGSSSQFQVNSSGSATAASLSLGSALTVANGGTGVSGLTGIAKGNGTGAFSAAVPGIDFQAPLILTTSGTSGAATLVGNTLNIPQYNSGSGASYTFSSGLTNNGDTITDNLAVGVNGGQTVIGGTQPTDKLVLQATSGSGAGASPAIQMSVGNNGATTAVTVQNSGNVGIGTTSPGKLLDVAGTIRTSANGSDTGGVVYPDGTQQTTAWTGVLCGGDYAEDMRTRGDKAKYQPGDVLVLASDDNSDVQKSSEPYSTLVAGIFAIKPGLVGRRAEITGSAANIPMAMVGVVPTKVSAENGPIRKGDLLVSSSRAGFAMKGTDRRRMLGAVIGKSMGSLDSGIGVIKVLVTLQ